jgi:hypothetical protein
MCKIATSLDQRHAEKTIRQYGFDREYERNVLVDEIVCTDVSTQTAREDTTWNT